VWDEKRKKEKKKENDCLMISSPQEWFERNADCLTRDLTVPASEIQP
jgi:hypothetical protein